MTDKKAPHGYDPDGIPLAPYGLNMDGSPRKSNRGARPGGRGGVKAPAKTTAAAVRVDSETDARRKALMIELANMFIVTPLAGLSSNPWVAKRMGPTQSDAFAGDAVIFSHFMPPTADALIIISQTKPQTLAWLDAIEEHAPYFMLAKVGIEISKSLVENHRKPRPDLAAAGRTLVKMNLARMAQDIEEQARAAGVEPEPARVPEPDMNMDPLI